MVTIALLLLASTLVVADEPNSAYAGANPVRIAACSTEPLFDAINAGDTIEEQQNGSELEISFMNTDAKTIASVTFAVQDGGKTTNIVDAGTFSPGAKISHEFGWWSYVADEVDCSVVSVRYADGSTWSQPVEAAARIGG